MEGIDMKGQDRHVWTRNKQGMDKMFTTFLLEQQVFPNGCEWRNMEETLLGN
jgi:hypothetical protein